MTAMQRKLEKFNPSRDRQNPAKAEALFKLIWPSERPRISGAKRMARSIRVAHNEAPGSWEVTMSARRIRLNVGQVMVMQFEADEIGVCLQTSRGRHLYSAVKVPSRSIRTDPDKIQSLSSKDWKAHERFLISAANAKRGSPWRRSFSEGVVKYLERVTGSSLPRPDYSSNIVSREPRLHILQGNKGADKNWLERAARERLSARRWVVPKSVGIGDEAVIFVGPYGFVATARIGTLAKPRSDWNRRYGAELRSIALIEPPIPLTAIRKAAPGLKWARFPRSYTTLDEPAAKQVRQLIKENRRSVAAPLESEWDEIKKIRNDHNLTRTQRETLIQARLGQGKFREELLRLWKRCPVTGSEALEVLRASHIKPWKDSTNRERLDPFNGFLLTPNLDALFDRMLISFDASGRILISKALARREQRLMGLSRRLRIPLRQKHRSYLRYHRERFYEKQKKST